MKRMTKNLTHKKNQEGITLLLAILILSAITVIVFTAASIVVSEIRSSAEITKSEPGITAAQAVAEELIYKNIRGVGTYASCTSPSVQTYSSNNTRVTSCVTYSLPVPYNFALAKNGEQDFYIYNPTDQTAAPGYTSVTIQITGGSSGTAYLCDFGTANCVTGPQLDVRSISVNGTSSQTFTLDPNTKYAFVIVNDAVADGIYKISSVPTGLPAGTTDIQSTGANQGVTRKIRTSVPQ